ncbi:NADAR family protein [Shewanella algae]|uniref:NADAR family protein n=1 Tax=Shewanella algae TaxID=38313 RepID=UPI001C979625|nr:NADAR family protein [Shewanella algae]
MKIRTREQLVDFVDQGNKVKYIFFWGHQEKGEQISKSCFSQWYDAKFEEEGNVFITAEHYMMYHKASYLVMTLHVQESSLPPTLAQPKLLVGK